MPPAPASPEPCIDQVNTEYLESLVGYNARRAALVIIELFLERMAVYDLRPVEFSVISLIAHNPGITSRQLCSTLGMLPPNLVGMVNQFEKRGLIVKRPHPSDGRATGLHPTPACEALMQQAEKTALDLEGEATARLSNIERKTLMRLLKKVYL
ncbi:MAG: MarR family winged helix-turn-helix transcriptional regulator [Pseudomonadota bacterium]|nr:MarR family winged helix-turn-helix transcriptional regulator [Pseudomonadota bacterium]